MMGTIFLVRFSNNSTRPSSLILQSGHCKFVSAISRKLHTLEHQMNTKSPVIEILAWLSCFIMCMCYVCISPHSIKLLKGELNFCESLCLHLSFEGCQTYTVFNFVPSVKQTRRLCEVLMWNHQWCCMEQNVEILYSNV